MEKFNHKDAIIFNKLFERYNSASLNIGILGDKIKFKRIYSSIKQKISNSDNVFILLNHNNFRVWNDDQEVDYILIETEQDLIGRNFRKFI